MKWFKKFRKEDTPSPMPGVEEYRYAIQWMDNWLEQAESTDERLMLLDYYLSVIKKDIQYDGLTNLIYRSEPSTLDWPFPYYCYDQNGNRLAIGSSDEEKIASLEKDCVIVIPWNMERMKANLANIWHKLFVYHPLNHIGVYFTNVDLFYLYNGNHSTASGLYFKKGEIPFKVINIEPLFANVDTDGAIWSDRHTGRRLEDSIDFRISILFEIARKKYNIERQAD